MKVGIFGQFYHKNSKTSIQELLDILQSKLANIHVEDDFFASIDGDNVILTDAKGNRAVITAVDITSSNGVIHVIDAVLMPKK